MWSKAILLSTLASFALAFPLNTTHPPSLLARAPPYLTKGEECEATARANGYNVDICVWGSCTGECTEALYYEACRARTRPGDPECILSTRPLCCPKPATALIKGLKFNANAEVLLSTSPLERNKVTFDDGDGSAPEDTWTFKISDTYVTNGKVTNAVKVSLKLGWDTGRIPFVGKGKAELTTDYSFTTESGWSTSKTKEQTISRKVRVPQGYKLEMKTISNESKYRVPFSYEYQVVYTTDAKGKEEKKDDGEYEYNGFETMVEARKIPNNRGERLGKSLDRKVDIKRFKLEELMNMEIIDATKW
ncbi:uncharacterized protein VTP21DRAFT_3849 [Calcarisporiella thermophila]|uniref:uncharacterized protein n=1 Tax=Calcarisporiella thermophila TaxID=911321 RepID=UPI003743F399